MILAGFLVIRIRLTKMKRIRIRNTGYFHHVLLVKVVHGVRDVRVERESPVERRTGCPGRRQDAGRK